MVKWNKISPGFCHLDDTEIGTFVGYAWQHNINFWKFSAINPKTGNSVDVMTMHWGTIEELKRDIKQVYGG